MHVILGATAVIDRDRSTRLPVRADRVRLVARTPTRGHDTDELVAADLLVGPTHRDGITVTPRS